jgi:hypothetical protein
MIMAGNDSKVRTASQSQRACLKTKLPPAADIRRADQSPTNIAGIIRPAAVKVERRQGYL